jgi:hypothetical protein
MIVDRTTIDCHERIVDSIIDKKKISKITSNHTYKPSGRRFVVGEKHFRKLIENPGPKFPVYLDP